MARSERVFALGVIVMLSYGCSSGDDDSGTSSGGAGGSSGTMSSAGKGGGSSASGGTGGSKAGGANGGSDAKGGSSGSAGAGSGGGGKGGSSGTAGRGGSSGTAPADPATIGGCDVFPADDDWNTDISGADVDADWTRRLMNIVGNVRLHPDYGGDASELYGIPIDVVPEDQTPLKITFDYDDESDPGPYPFRGPDDAKIEGGSATDCDGDCHVLVVQQGTCQLYEGWACLYDSEWHCGSGAKWDLTKIAYGQRPKGWTSADAAGLPITPGIVRYDEVRAGALNHAIRFTVNCSSDYFVKPGTHHASTCDDADAPPMGLRVRMKADFDISSLSASAQVVATAMKKYGMILADNGSNFYFQGEANLGWTEDDIEPLKGIPASAFEVITVPPLEQ